LEAISGWRTSKAALWKTAHADCCGQRDEDFNRRLSPSNEKGERRRAGFIALIRLHSFLGKQTTASRHLLFLISFPKLTVAKEQGKFHLRKLSPFWCFKLDLLAYFLSCRQVNHYLTLLLFPLFKRFLGRKKALPDDLTSAPSTHSVCFPASYLENCPSVCKSGSANKIQIQTDVFSFCRCTRRVLFKYCLTDWENKVRGGGLGWADERASGEIYFPPAAAAAGNIITTRAERQERKSTLQ
jgi:hypothetical protein